LGLHLPVYVIFEHPDIERLAEFIRQQAGGAEPSPAVALKPEGDNPPLFLVHALGGHLLSYTPLARCMTDVQPLYAFEALGGDGLREPLRTVEEMAEAYIAAMQKIQPQGPYLLGGWSMGGSIAWEMAQRLTERGYTVALLLLLDTVLTDLFGAGEPLEDDGTNNPEVVRINIRFATTFALELEAKFGRAVPVKEAELAPLNREQQFEYIVARAREVGLMQSDFESKLMRKLYNVCWANLQANMRYSASFYDGKVTYFMAEEKKAEVKTMYLEADWRQYTSCEPDIVEVPGNHESMLREPHVRKLQQKLADCIERGLTAIREKSRA
jgi:thioesterase domain-containing protein